MSTLSVPRGDFSHQTRTTSHMRLASYRAGRMKLGRGNPWDKAVIRMSQHGFTANVVNEFTGLSLSQISYRRRQFACGPRTWARGISPEARALLARIDKVLSPRPALAAFMDSLKKRS